MRKGHRKKGNVLGFGLNSLRIPLCFQIELKCAISMAYGRNTSVDHQLEPSDTLRVYAEKTAIFKPSAEVLFVATRHLATVRTLSKIREQL